MILSHITKKKKKKTKRLIFKKNQKKISKKELIIIRNDYTSKHKLILFQSYSKMKNKN